MLRLLCLLCALLVAWGVAYALFGANHIGLTMLAGACVWYLLDTSMGKNLVRWLHKPMDSTPKVFGVWGDVRDSVVRELRKSERKTIEAKSRLEDFLSAIQQSPNGVILLNADDAIEWCNLIAAQHFGIEPERDHLQLIGNLVRNPEFMQYLHGGDYQHEVIMTSGRAALAQSLRLAVHIHPYGKGRKLLLSRDITALEQAEVMRRDFVANVSHEIRTPLTVLAGFVETMQTIDSSPAEQKRYLALMQQQASRMQNLVGDLLTLSKLEGSPLPSMQEYIPVAALIAQCIEDGQNLARALAPANKVERTIHLQGAELAQIYQISGAQSELYSAMSNLVSNAVRYTPPEGEIVLTWRVNEDGSGEFRVQDSGVGIAPEHLPRLTERFYRVDSSRSRESGGTGLGLAIVKHVLQRHGALLIVKSTQGKGSLFGIRFPASRLKKI